MFFVFFSYLFAIMLHVQLEKFWLSEAASLMGKAECHEFP